ncbi:hypothetical protein ACQP2X_13310 [Actinoplanes sp. CA-131856]
MKVDLSLYLVTDARLAASSGHDLAALVLAAADPGAAARRLRTPEAAA